MADTVVIPPTPSAAPPTRRQRSKSQLPAVIPLADDSSVSMRIERAPDVVLDEARRAARALQDVIASKKKKVMFGGEQYLELEDWETLGRFYGLSARTVSDRYIEFGKVTGFEAQADIIRADGAVVSSATAMCLSDEKNWQGKPLFQLRSMAQTRAVAKGFRLCLSWVAVLAGYRGTPAEEMDRLTRVVEEVVPLAKDEARDARKQGGGDGTTPSPTAAINLTRDQKVMLAFLGNTLEPPWPVTRYAEKLAEYGGFLPVRDLLLALHRQDHGEDCSHFAEASHAAAAEPSGVA